MIQTVGARWRFAAITSACLVSASFVIATPERAFANQLPDYYLPWAAGLSHTVTQGNGGAFSHTGLAQYAWDFGGDGWVVASARAGSVSGIQDSYGPGACNQQLQNQANYLMVRSGDVDALYLHLAQGSVSSRVSPNEVIPPGIPVAVTDSSGYVCGGAHLHFMVQGVCGNWWCQSVPSSFLDSDVLRQDSDGVPLVNQSVVSSNFGGSAQSNGEAAAQSNGNVDVFWQGTDGQLWHKWYDATGWNGPSPMGGSLASEPSATATSLGVNDVFWQGTDDNLWHVYKVGGVWYGPASLGMGPLGSAPHAVGQANGYVDIFWRGPRGSMLHSWFNGLCWCGPATIIDQDGTGALATEPSPVASSAGVVDVFWTSFDNNLWHVSRVTQDGAWSAPASLGIGTVGSAPHAVGQPNGYIDVFWKGSGGDIQHSWYNGACWCGPVSMQGSLASEPSPTVSSSGVVLDVLWEGTDTNLWHVYRVGGTWYGPSSLGMGPLGSGPRAVGQINGVIDVFWKGTDSQLVHAFYNGGWYGPAPFGGSISTWP